MNTELPKCDKDGFLIDGTAWNKELAELLAAADGIVLTPLHWCVLNFLRKFYRDYSNTPSMRALVKELKSHAISLGVDEATINSATLTELFTSEPLKQASRIAGLPKPARCL